MSILTLISSFSSEVRTVDVSSTLPVEFVFPIRDSFLYSGDSGLSA